jgi:hypothetical protein
MTSVHRPGFAIAMTTALVIGALTGLWGASYPVPNRVLVITGAGLMAVALISALADSMLVGRGPVWYWPTLVLVAALAVTAYLEHWPLEGRWAASEKPFSSIVNTLPEAGGLGTWERPQSTPAPARIGLYGIERVEIAPNAYLFVTRADGNGADGFIYLPGGPDSVPGELGYDFVHLDGPWYAFEQRP